MRKAISKEEFLHTGAVYADTLQKAFDQYRHAMLHAADKDDMKEFVIQLARESSAVYGDFYYSRLSVEEKAVFTGGLTETEKVMLQTFETDNDQVFYLLDEEAMDFLFEVTARNWLFTTFYFIGKDVMVWGNYNLEFPIFCKTQIVLDSHLTLAKKCGLEIL